MQHIVSTPWWNWNFLTGEMSHTTSKITDASGLPRTLYHGTNAPEDFHAFAETGVPREILEEEEAGWSWCPTSLLGPHFAFEAHIASAFAVGQAAQWTRDRRRHVVSRCDAGARVIPVIISMQNPKLYATERHLWADMCPTVPDFDSFSHRLEMLDDERYAEVCAPGSDDMFAFIEQVLADDRETGLWAAHEEMADGLRTRLISQGHDGIIYGNDIEGGTALVAFFPAQVKSIFARHFDPKSDTFTD